MAPTKLPKYNSQMLSVIIPTLQASDTLEATLRCFKLADDLVSEIIVSDGGSTDQTVAMAKSHQIKIINAPKGRGNQLAAGANAACNQWLLFVHADTGLGQNWQSEVLDFINDGASHKRAAVFKFALDDPSLAARRIENMVAWRCQKLALPYGDQGLLISKSFYDEIGGYPEIPLFEDVNIIRRIGRHRLTLLEETAITTAIRYQKNGYYLRPLRNIFCLGLYFIGLSPRLIRKLY